MKTEKFPKGKTIIEENSTGENIYFIVSGKVKVIKTIDNEKMELAELGPNTFFGEMSMFLEHKRSATVIAAEDTEVMIGDKKAFINTITKNPDKAILVISTLVQRLKEAHDIISDLEGQRKAYEILLTPFEGNK